MGSRMLTATMAAFLLMAPAAGAFTAHGSVEQVYVTGAHKGARVTLLDRRGHRVARRRAGSLGAVVFRNVKPGKGYRIAGHAKRLRVLPKRSKPPSTKLYGQKIPTSGYGYLTTRDGTKLAIDVHLPAGPGPYPTLFEYSGYASADPAGAHSSIGGIANLLGFAVVDVNMRGTGCSGGAFDYFEPLQGLDGYDVVETVARQPWVLHHKVGMVGISYGGISQLFVAATRPPSLAAITQLSVIDNTQTTLYPGGILNTGFPLSWAKERMHDAKPASPTAGQPWALDRIKAGDKTCKANQALHTEAIDQVAKVRANSYYVPKVADPLAPITFVHRIKAPVFLACQFTDEQTGGHCPALASRFTGTRHKWMTFTNGTHIDALDPATFNRWYDFLQLYVARRAPRLPDAAKAAVPAIFAAAMGVHGVRLPDDRIQAEPTYAAAKAAFEKLPPVRILFDNGAGAQPGAPVPGFERSFSRFPLPGTRAGTWWLSNPRALTEARPTSGGAGTFTWSKTARPATDFSGDTGAGDLWTASPTYNWTQHPAGTSLSYVSAPLAASAVVVGAGALEAWIKSSARDVDLQVTVSEVRPDGKETFVQSGWLRTSRRKLDRRKSTTLAPVLSLRRRDATPMPKGRYAKVTVPLYYQGHVYRANSRLRVTIAAPGGDQPLWAFARTRPHGTAKVSLLSSAKRPSRLLLPVVGGVSAPTGLPPCPGLRGQPCRDYAGR
jgi:predicted acyl esterase